MVYADGITIIVFLFIKVYNHQAFLILNMHIFQHESQASYRVYINAVLGFFILEDHVLNTGNGLITRVFLDDMWTMALSKIVTVLQTNTVHLQNLNLIFCTINVLLHLGILH